MSDHMKTDEQIQSLYNQTKNLHSPSDLDDLILGKIRSLEEQPEPVKSEKLWFYLPIAASILLIVLLQFQGADKSDYDIQQPVKVVQLPTPKKTPPRLKNMQKHQLPELYFLPTEDINNKVVRACTGGLVTPGDRIEALNKRQKPVKKDKPSNIPIQQMYPNDAIQNDPKCDSVSNQVFKKQ